jgi:hypothetical protein
MAGGLLEQLAELAVAVLLARPGALGVIETGSCARGAAITVIVFAAFVAFAIVVSTAAFVARRVPAEVTFAVET